MIHNTPQISDQPQNARVFNPNEHLIQIKNRGSSADYLPVQWRLVWFRSQFPQGTIETEIVHLDLDRETEEEKYEWNSETRRSEKVIKRAPGIAIFRATVKDGLGGVGVGTKSERAASFADFMEKAETGAIGRALAVLGYGTQFTGDEFEEKHRIVDSPVAATPAASANEQQSNEKRGSEDKSTQKHPDPNGPATAQQIQSIQNISQRLGKTAETPANYGAAKALIAELSQEYRQSRAKAS